METDPSVDLIPLMPLCEVSGSFKFFLPSFEDLYEFFLDPPAYQTEIWWKHIEGENREVQHKFCL